MSLGLLGAYDSSSGSSDTDDDAAKPIQTGEKALNSLSNPFKSDFGSTMLPKPSFMTECEDFTNNSHGAARANENSVFSNPFRDREAKKTAVLEQHVGMTVRQEDRRTIDGKKICWNFRKGRCRFGHKCTFAHDSDVNVSKPPTIRDRAPDISVAPIGAQDKQSKQLPSADSLSFAHQSTSNSEEDTESSKNRKRPGLSSGIVPSKRAMKFHNKVYNK